MIHPGVYWYEPLTANNVVTLEALQVIVVKFPGRGEWITLYTGALAT